MVGQDQKTQLGMTKPKPGLVILLLDVGSPVSPHSSEVRTTQRPALRPGNEQNQGQKASLALRVDTQRVSILSYDPSYVLPRRSVPGAIPDDEAVGAPG